MPLESLRRTVRNKQQAGGGGGGGGEEEPGSPAAPPPPQGDQMVLVVSTERGAACHALPSQKLTHNYTVPVSTKIKIMDSDDDNSDCIGQDVFTLLRAQTVSWLGDEKSNCVLMCLTSDGRVKGGDHVNIYGDHAFRPRNRFVLLQYFFFSFHHHVQDT